MLMKVFNKGQVVIPARIRHGLGIGPGDLVEVEVDLHDRKIELRPHQPTGSASLAGSLAKYAHHKSPPTRKQAAHFLEKGLLNES
jgi:AbrB family looped-hinge helix DNA binding protein